MKNGISPGWCCNLQAEKSPLIFDIHTHTIVPEGVWGLRNLRETETPEPASGLYSMGVHPWYADPLHWKKQLEQLRVASRSPRVLAIGECGLDKVCQVPFSLQETVFAAQVEWANRLGKPLLIHCVRAWEELLQLLEMEKNKVPVIFHGFVKNAALAARLTAKGYYISLGKALEKPAMQQVLRQLPGDRFFLETDDAGLPVAQVYQWAAAALAIDSNSLALQMQENVKAVFGKASGL